MNRLSRVVLVAVTVAIGACATHTKAPEAEPPTQDRLPRIDPDYADVTIPPNIAPLNFVVNEPGEAFEVAIRSTHGEALDVSSESAQIRIPAGAWRKLLAANHGQDLLLHVSVRQADGRWERFQPISQHVAQEKIDGYLVYRLLKPLYNKYVNIGIYQRHLESFDQKPVLENSNADHACLNCHTFVRNQPDPMVLQTRSEHGLTMLLARGQEVTTIDTRTAFNKSPAAYTSWHPGGRHIGFSVNKVSLFLHTDPTRETREVFDAGSDLAVYSTEDNILTTTAAISDPDRAETWPEWSPDGRHLYFSSAPILPIEQFEEVRYDLMRIPFDVDSGTWGDLDTLLTAGQTGLTVTQPKVSPDGRWLVFTMADHGNFPIFSATADLYVMDLLKGGYRRLEINSDLADSWHSWSSNGRWLVFSSKRRDGLFARPYFSYVDEEGRFHRPVLMPQEDPTFYDAFIKTYNVPVFITGPVKVSERNLARAIYDPDRPLSAQLDPRVASALQQDAGDGPVEPYSSGTTR
ncbi:MAG TPA: hypothetical protein QGF95_05440 [Candidatus Latescibacteria bacterium]|jgi:hypothetical protein|nr:hypothetical protein [Candidatus Latescibacterota bacterium]HJP29980.1 hypothetical protein [Candidatus Latescibacterota bacterium]